MQKRADRADQSVLFFLAGANFWEKHAKNRRKHAKTGAFLVLIFLGEKLAGANFYAFCNYGRGGFANSFATLLWPFFVLKTPRNAIKTCNK